MTEFQIILPSSTSTPLPSYSKILVLMIAYNHGAWSRCGIGETNMIIRDGTSEDVEQISSFLRELTASGKRTRPDDEAFVLANYIDDPDKICCCVAEADGVILGFQSLKRARADNDWGVESGWGIIGTHIRLSAARRGVGRALFNVTRIAAAKAGLQRIDASIMATNPVALAYYEAIGFRSYRTPKGMICKRFDV